MVENRRRVCCTYQCTTGICIKHVSYNIHTSQRQTRGRINRNVTSPTTSRLGEKKTPPRKKYGVTSDYSHPAPKLSSKRTHKAIPQCPTSDRAYGVSTGLGFVGTGVEYCCIGLRCFEWGRGRCPRPRRLRTS
jgi:hypothetical protein